MIKNNKITKYAGFGILTAAIILGASQHTNNSNSKEGKKTVGISSSITVTKGASYDNEHEYFIPDGYHLEEGSKIVKNPEGLVDASFVPEIGYHLEQYDYDNNLFYVIKDGYHNEHGYLIPDGYHLEGTTITKDIAQHSFARTLKLK